MTENLSKQYGAVRAVSDLSVSIGQGEIYGFLGLNGAGKTTTIRMLLGLIRPTAGSANISGQRMHAGQNDVLRDVGYLVEVPYSYPELTVRQNLEIIARLRFIRDSNAVDRIIEKLHLTEYSDRKAKHLSLGNSQRLGLAKALIHKPRLLILDEPSNGLDPAGIVEVRELLRDMAAKEGVTVFISSHILSEISRLATRIGIIHQGTLIKELDTSELDRLSEKRLLIGTADLSAAAGILTRNGYSNVEYLQGKLAVADNKAIGHPEAIAQLLCDAGHPPGMLVVSEEDLETYFLRTIGVKSAVI